MAVRDTFDAIAPALATDPLADTFLEFAVDQMNPVVWGKVYELGVAYLAAHMLTIARRTEAAGPSGGGSGPITSKRAGQVAIQYGQMSSSANSDLTYYQNTPYGIEFLRLRKSRAGTHMFSTSPGFFTRLRGDGD